MIIFLKENTSAQQVEQLIASYGGFQIIDQNHSIIITSSKHKSLRDHEQDFINRFLVFDSDLQLASKKYYAGTRAVKIGNQTIGGATNNTLVIAGPCSVENADMIHASARHLSGVGIKVLRGGCFKPRTSPYSFQGLGSEGLRLLREAADAERMSIITEVKDATHVDEVIQKTDIIQIGAKAMYDQGILKACAAVQKPVLIKRGFGSSLQEFVQAAEFILSGGNPNVILCERGIRSFETKTRFTLDLCGVAYLKEHTNLPIILDPSHAMGYAYGIADLTRACVAMGVDGLLIEVHPDPKSALSDAAQQLNFSEFTQLYDSLGPVAQAVGRQII